MKSSSAWLALAALVVTMVWTRDATACHDSDGDARKVVCFTSLHAGVATAVFAPADIYYATEDSWLPPTWAWPQLVLGGLATMGGSGAAIGLAAAKERHPAATIGWASGLVVLGGMYGSGAIFSLQKYLPPGQPSGADHALRFPLLTVVPTDGGAMVTATF